MRCDTSVEPAGAENTKKPASCFGRASAEPGPRGPGSSRFLFSVPLFGVPRAFWGFLLKSALPGGGEGARSRPTARDDTLRIRNALTRFECVIVRVSVVPHPHAQKRDVRAAAPPCPCPSY